MGGETEDDSGAIVVGGGVTEISRDVETPLLKMQRCSSRRTSVKKPECQPQAVGLGATEQQTGGPGSESESLNTVRVLQRRRAATEVHTTNDPEPSRGFTAL